MAHEIDLGGGIVAFVDGTDKRLVREFSWRALKSGNTIYVGSGYGEGRVLLHRLLLSAPDDVFVDHIDGDGLNNRRSNLRLCSHSENMKNRAKLAPATSPFKGVRAEAGKEGWYASIRPEGMHIRLGVFKSEHAAARAYDRAARLMFGRFARTNEDLGLFQVHEDRQRYLSHGTAKKKWRSRMAAIGIAPQVAARM